MVAKILSLDLDWFNIIEKKDLRVEIFNFFDVSLGYNIEDVVTSNFSSQVPGFFRENSSGLTSSVLSNIAYDTRNNRVQTSKGMLHSISSEYAGNGVGGDNDFWKLNVESRVFFSLPGRTVLKGRGVFGYVKSLNSGRPVPLFERYFMGGGIQTAACRQTRVSLIEIKTA